MIDLVNSDEKTIGFKGEFLNLKIDTGCDLRKEIELYFEEKHVKLGTVFNAFGTLTKARLDLSREPIPLELDGSIQLLSSSGIVRNKNHQLDTI